MIARTWRGAVNDKDAEPYLEYLHKTGLAEYRSTPGNLGVLALRRTIGGNAEFLLITLWESEAAIQRFAGEEIGKAVFYSEDDAFLVNRDDFVNHYDVVYQSPEKTR
ncbi:MAG: hypothetical protein ABI613_09615 [Gemmatimonadota bacterium]